MIEKRNILEDGRTPGFTKLAEDELTDAKMVELFKESAKDVDNTERTEFWEPKSDK